MQKITLASGKTVLSIVKRPESVSVSESSGAAADQMESTSGAMLLEQNGICPKCSQRMGLSKACGEDVYYCDPCRVCLPLPISA